jgi:hypothetical protein
MDTKLNESLKFIATEKKLAITQAVVSYFIVAPISLTVTVAMYTNFSGDVFYMGYGLLMVICFLWKLFNINLLAATVTSEAFRADENYNKKD